MPTPEAVTASQIAAILAGALAPTTWLWVDDAYVLAKDAGLGVLDKAHIELLDLGPAAAVAATNQFIREYQ